MCGQQPFPRGFFNSLSAQLQHHSTRPELSQYGAQSVPLLCFRGVKDAAVDVHLWLSRIGFHTCHVCHSFYLLFMQRFWRRCCQCTPPCCCHRVSQLQLSPASSTSHLLPHQAPAYSCSTIALWWCLQSRCSWPGSCSSSRSSGRTCRSQHCRHQRRGMCCQAVNSSSSSSPGA